MLKPLDSHKSVTVSTMMTHDRPDVLRFLNIILSIKRTGLTTTMKGSIGSIMKSSASIGATGRSLDFQPYLTDRNITNRVNAGY